VIVGGDTGPVVDVAIDTFTPLNEVTSWGSTSGFVRASVRRADPYNVRKAREWMMIGSRHTEFCFVNHGLELNDDIWNPDLADAFLRHWGVGRQPRTVAAGASQLHDLIRRIGTDTRVGLGRHRRYRSRPKVPYAPADIPRLYAWANTRRERRTRRTAYAILGLGLGFGLDGATMTSVHAGDIVDHGTDGVELVLGDRSSWCDTDYEEDLRTVIAQRPDDGLLIELTARNTLVQFLGTSRKASRPIDAIVPELDRLRASWFAARSTHFASLIAVMDAYGIRHTSTLQSVFAHLPQPTPDQIRNALRTKGTL
jgi:hypothetical protein